MGTNFFLSYWLWIHYFFLYSFENEDLVFPSQPVVTDLTAIFPTSTSKRKKSRAQNTESALLFTALIFLDLFSTQQAEEWALQTTALPHWESCFQPAHGSHFLLYWKDKDVFFLLKDASCCWLLFQILLEMKFNGGISTTKAAHAIYSF